MSDFLAKPFVQADLIGKIERWATAALGAALINQAAFWAPKPSKDELKWFGYLYRVPQNSL